MKVETRRILSAMTSSPNPADIEAALKAIDRGAEVVASPSGVHPSELAKTWAGRRNGPFLPPAKRDAVDGLLAEFAEGGAAPWALRSISLGAESFVLFVDAKGVGRACIQMTP